MSEMKRCWYCAGVGCHIEGCLILPLDDEITKLRADLAMVAELYFTDDNILSNQNMVNILTKYRKVES